MPSMYVIGKVKLSPWAGDDLHILCFLWLGARFSQLIAILGLLGGSSVAKWMQIGTPYKGETTYCIHNGHNITAGDNTNTSLVTDYHNNTINSSTAEIERSKEIEKMIGNSISLRHYTWRISSSKKKDD